MSLNVVKGIAWFGKAPDGVYKEPEKHRHSYGMTNHDMSTSEF